MDVCFLLTIKSNQIRFRKKNYQWLNMTDRCLCVCRLCWNFLEKFIKLFSLFALFSLFQNGKLKKKFHQMKSNHKPVFVSDVTNIQNMITNDCGCIGNNG